MAMRSDIVVHPGMLVKDVMTLGGSIRIRPGVRVTGDVLSLWGDITLERGACVEGDVMTLFGTPHPL